MRVDTSSASEEMISEEMVKPVEMSQPKGVLDKSAPPEIESDEDSGIMNASSESIDVGAENAESKGTDAAASESSEVPSWRLHIPPKLHKLSDREILDFEKRLFDEMSSVPAESRKKWTVDKVRATFGELLPETLIELIAAQAFDGDSEVSMDAKPDWLDMDKFRRGQRFVQEYNFGITYAEVISLFTVFSFEDGLKPLIMTGASGTPYTAFKRYLSTNLRMNNWYRSDPWTPGTPAYNDMRSVRKIHALVRKRLQDMSEDEFERRTTISAPWCPSLSVTRQDFQSTCPAPAPGQCPYVLYDKLANFKAKKLSQGEMVATQFAFVGLVALHPRFFGIHHATDEDLESFCHVWRSIGYLLGIDDDFNFCRGTLEDVRTRARDFLEYWVKPNFREIKPEWEHMMRCVLEGVQYYFPGATYETSLLDVASIMNLHMPRLYGSLSYPVWIKHCIIRFYFNQGSKVASLRYVMNRGLMQAIDRAKQFNEKKHRELQERSDKTLTAYALQLQKSNIADMALVE